MQKKFSEALNSNLKKGWESTKKKSVKVYDKMKLKGDFKELAYPWILISFLLIVLPIIILMFYSIYDTTSGNIITITFSNYGQFFSTFAMTQVLLTSILMASIATLFCLLIGYPVAYLMAEITNKRNKKMIWILVTMPIWINMLIRIISMQVFLQSVAPSILGTYFAVILGMIYTFIPFMILPLYDHLSNRDKNLEMAALDLGASKWYTFRKITFPNSLGSIYSGSLLVLLPAMTTIVITHYMSSGTINSMGNMLENLFVSGYDYTYGAAVAIITMGSMVLMILLLKLLTKQRIRKDKTKEVK